MWSSGCFMGLPAGRGDLIVKTLGQLPQREDNCCPLVPYGGWQCIRIPILEATTAAV